MLGMALLAGVGDGRLRQPEYAVAVLRLERNMAGLSEKSAGRRPSLGVRRGRQR